MQGKGKIMKKTEKKGFTIEATKARYDKASKSYIVRESFKIKGIYIPSKTKNKKTISESIVLTVKGCAIVCTKGVNDSIKLSEKAYKLDRFEDLERLFLQELKHEQYKIVRKYLLGRYNLKGMRFSTLKDKCEILK